MMATMTSRPFLPCTADSVYLPATKKDRKRFEGGTRSEPGHRQQVRVRAGGRWFSAVYDRVSCSFWQGIKGLGFFEVVGKVETWTQRPPGPGFRDPS